MPSTNNSTMATEESEESEETEAEATGRGRWLRRLRPHRPSWTRRRSFLPSALAVLLVALIGVSLWLWLGNRQTIDDAPTVVARQEAKNFFTLDYRHPDHDLDRVQHLATNPFKHQYQKRRGAIKKGIAAKHLTLSASIPDNGSALEYEHGKRAQVLVAVNATTKTKKGAHETARNRVRVRLDRTDHGWRISKLTQVG